MLLCFIAYVHVDHFVHLFLLIFSVQADERSNVFVMNERFLVFLTSVFFLNGGLFNEGSWR